MRKGAGIQAQKETGIGQQLDEFIGSWSNQEADLFNRQTGQLRTIDDEIWQ